MRLDVTVADAHAVYVRHGRRKLMHKRALDLHRNAFSALREASDERVHVHLNGYVGRLSVWVALFDANKLDVFDIYSRCLGEKNERK